MLDHTLVSIVSQSELTHHTQGRQDYQNVTSYHTGLNILTWNIRGLYDKHTYDDVRSLLQHFCLRMWANTKIRIIINFTAHFTTPYGFIIHTERTILPIYITCFSPLELASD